MGKPKIKSTAVSSVSSKASAKPKKNNKDQHTKESVFKNFTDLENFVFPEDDVNENVLSKDHNLFEREISRSVKRDEKSIELLNLAVKHTRVYDSKDTATELMNRAYKNCTSLYNRKLISQATFALKAAIKAEKWMNSRTKRRHVDKDTISNNLSKFYEKLNDAVLSIKIEIEKRTNKLFTRIKTEYKTDLPLEIPESKTYIIKTTNIIAQCAKTPSCKNMHLEGNLFLLQNVDVIGVNLQKTNSSIMKAEDIAEKNNCTIYPQILSRPSKNIHWFLMLKFGTKISYASFTDALDVSASSDTSYSSYEEYVKVKESDRKLKEKLKTQRLKEYRNRFEEDNRPVIEDIKELNRQLHNLLDARTKLKEDLAGLTVISDSDTGLTTTTIGKLSKFIQSYKDEKHYVERLPYQEVVHLASKQKIAAKATFYEIQDTNRQINAIRTKIKFLESDKAKRKHNYALELGLVSLNRISEL